MSRATRSGSPTSVATTCRHRHRVRILKCGAAGVDGAGTSRRVGAREDPRGRLHRHAHRALAAVHQAQGARPGDPLRLSAGPDRRTVSMQKGLGDRSPRPCLLAGSGLVAWPTLALARRRPVGLWPCALTRVAAAVAFCRRRWGCKRRSARQKKRHSRCQYHQFAFHGSLLY
jgi:hypothetical protein